MDTVFKYDDNVIISQNMAQIMEWKNSNVLSTMPIKLIDDSISINEILYLINEQIMIGDNSEEFNNCTDKSINSFLTYIDHNYFTTKTKENPKMDIDMNMDDIADNYLLSLILKRVDVSNKNNYTVSATMRNNDTILITIAQNENVCILHINQELTIYIEYVTNKPYILFRTLLLEYIRKESLHHINLIIEYVAESLANDIEMDKVLEPDVDSLILQTYKIYSITIKEYLWESTENICPYVIAKDTNESMLEKLKDLKEIYINNASKLTMSHLYIIVPIISYYINITDIQIFLNNINHYSILMTIMRLFRDKWNIIIDCDIVNALQNGIDNIDDNNIKDLMTEYIWRFA